MRIIFFGSDDFAATHLEKLLHSRHHVLLAVTQPDRPKGRHLKISFSPVKEIALRYHKPVLQPLKPDSKEFLRKLKTFPCDIFIVIAYGLKLPSEILSFPKIFCINVHASLLPKYRGAAPINWAVINGETTTGVTVMKLNRKIDAGEIISQQKVPVTLKATALSLKMTLAQTGSGLLLKTLESIEKKTFSLTPQDPSQVTYAPKLTKEHGKIPWDKPAREIYNLVRGLVPWPAAFTHYGCKKLKVLEAQPLSSTGQDAFVGEVVSVTSQGIHVATGQGVLRLLRVTPESSHPMSAHSFAIGHKITPGFRFGA